MTSSNPSRSALTPQDIHAVSPALASYTQKSIPDDRWKRPSLSARDRSIPYNRVRPHRSLGYLTPEESRMAGLNRVGSSCAPAYQSLLTVPIAAFGAT